MCFRSNFQLAYLAPGLDTVNTEEVLASVELPPKSNALKADRALPTPLTVPSLHLNLLYSIIKFYQSPTGQSFHQPFIRLVRRL